MCLSSNFGKHTVTFGDGRRGLKALVLTMLAFGFLGAGAAQAQVLDDSDAEWFNAFNEVAIQIARDDAGVAANRSRDVRNSLLTTDRRVVQVDRAATAGGNGSATGVWAAANWNKSDIETGNGFMGYDFDTFGLYGGVDFLVAEGILIGAMVGFNDSDVDFDNRTGNGDVDSWMLGGYVSWFFNNWFFDLNGGYGDMDIESARDVVVGALPLVASSAYDGDYYYAYGKTGFVFEPGNGGLKITPSVSIQAIEVIQNRIVETGGTLANFDINKEDAQSIRGAAELTVAKVYGSGGPGSLAAYVRGGIAHEFEDGVRPITGTLLAQGTAFQTFGEVPRGTTAVFGIGATANVSHSLSVFVDYAGEVGSDFDAHSVRGGARLNF